MDILKAFSLCGREYNINIQGTFENPLFQANQIGNLLELKNMHNQICKFNDKQKVLLGTESLGGMQKTVFLTEAGLYRLLSRSNKPIAEEFQNWICDVIKEIRINGEYKLKEKNEIDNKIKQEREKRNTHSKLLDAYNKKNVVYICKLKDEPDEKYIIKIGSTQDVKTRISNIGSTYGTIPLIIDIFESRNHTKFENWIHTNETIKKLFYPMKKLDGIITRETFLVNDEQYDTIVSIIKTQLKQFEPEENNVEKLIELEEKRKITAQLNFEAEETRKLNNELELQKEQLEKEKISTQIELMNKIESIQNTVVLPEKENSIIHDYARNVLKNSLIKPRNPVRSPKVYQYDANTLELLNIYDSVIDVIRRFASSSQSALKLAAKNNTIYKNYRWLLVDRNTTEIPVLEPTKQIRTQAIEYIAMIDIKRTKIMEVFSSQKQAAEARNLAGFSTISRAIKKQSISSGHYWELFNKCSQEMRDEYLLHHELPEKFTKTNGLKIVQIDPITNEELKTFSSMTDVVLGFQMSHMSLKRAAENDIVHNGFKWRIIRE
jgi:prophage antirepressor-like protein